MRQGPSRAKGEAAAGLLHRQVRAPLLVVQDHGRRACLEISDGSNGLAAILTNDQRVVVKFGGWRKRFPP
jgi:hypothetical protein